MSKVPPSAILTINGGSSSIKFAVFERAEPLHRVLQGQIERIGSSGAAMSVRGPDGGLSTQAVVAPDHAAAVQVLIDWIDQHHEVGRSGAIGHRVVHGGPKFSGPVRLSSSVIETLRSLSPFDRQHLPQEILLIEAFQRRYPDVPQFACFDTAYFHALPRVAQILPIPRRFEAKGIRRYGFHGLSYAFLMEELARQAGMEAAASRVIVAHLGNGASLAAMKAGKAVDTSMAFTPAAGIPMGTRSGDLDPGLVSYFARVENMTPDQFDTMVNFESGLLGISETSSDMRDLLGLEATDVRAAEAVAVFCYQIRKWTGAFAASMGGLDQLVFAGGVGEHAATVRARICEGLEFLGVELDATRNEANAALISSGGGQVDVRVIATDEERVIAESVVRILGGSAPNE